MKNYFNALIFFTCIFAGCAQQTSNNEAIQTGTLSPTADENKQTSSESKDEAELNNLDDFGRLVPIEILNSKSQDVYEKYGIESDGNCYTCDLAVMHINKKHFDIINVCDSTDFYRYEDVAYEAHSTELKIRTGKAEFIFTKIETAPVYELKITGDILALKNKRISRFYTRASDLNKFKQHDCGEFEG